MSSQIYFQYLVLVNKQFLSLSPTMQSAQNRLLIKNGKVLNADGIEDADVYIEDGVIK